MACDSCEVTVYNTVEKIDSKVCIDKMLGYNITSLPAVAVNGKLLECCNGRGLSRDELIAAGVGKTI